MFPVVCVVFVALGLASIRTHALCHQRQLSKIAMGRKDVYQTFLLVFDVFDTNFVLVFDVLGTLPTSMDRLPTSTIPWPLQIEALAAISGH